ncbi:phosphoesterase [Nocardioides szechwanensis]|uniref:CehA/McbA family metallohydrolase n=1 Tax=Nocardioides szechwanensis TaxID=1005944 RepID=UPI000B84B7EF|nr:CehA/McbA family metallohydrolase [Nocardioides szechwanensis]GEP33925.1 phosphoesterase [Nocardioides szechwanensis]
MCDHHADHHPGPDRRSLLLAGAGVATYAAAQGVAPAAAGTTRTLRFGGRFTGANTPDWHYLPVRVPRGVRAIEIAYDYESTNTGAGFSLNVIDIGIFDPSGHGLGDAHGFRGWSGGARKKFRISPSGATPGYLAGPITPGVWQVILGPVAIVPPGVEWSVTVTLHFGRPGRRFRPQPPPRAVRGTGPGWYRGDLHLHTVHSDGKRTQAGLVRDARAAGLDFIGSSEHNTSSAGLTWGRHVKPGDPLLVLCGEEVTTRTGHWLAMGVPAGAWVDWRYRAEDGQLARFTKRVRGLGGMAIACHPWVPIPATKWDFGYDYAAMDAVEIWNGPWTLDDQVGVEHWHTMLVEGRFVPVIGNSDAHNESQTVGQAQTVVRASTLSTAAVVHALKLGRSWLAESSDVDLTFEASLGGTTVSCGDRLTAAPTDLVDVRLEVSGAPNCVAQVHGPLGPLAGAVTTDGGATVTVQVPAGVTPFVRAEVRRLDGAPVVNPLDGVPGLAMVAMTNPVFLG